MIPFNKLFIRVFGTPSLRVLGISTYPSIASFSTIMKILPTLRHFRHELLLLLSFIALGNETFAERSHLVTQATCSS